MTTHLPVLFQCVPLGTRLTRRACGMRHIETRIAGKGGNSKRLVRDATCAECSIGKLHSNGHEPTRWPDGEPLRLVAEIGTPQPPGTPAARPVVLPPFGSHVAKPSKPIAPIAAPPKPVTPITEESPMPAPKKLTYQGRTQSESDWARELGLSVNGFAHRIHRATKRGMSQDEALAHAIETPRGAQVGRPSGGRVTKIEMLAAKSVATGPAIAAPITPAKMETLARPIAPIEGAPTLETLSPSALLVAAGFKVLHATKVPAGFAIFIEAP
jgi:hypothetical protein